MINLLVVLLKLDHGLLERGRHALRSVEKPLSCKSGLSYNSVIK